MICATIQIFENISGWYKNSVEDYIHLANEISVAGPVFSDQILVTFQAARRERSVHNTQVGQKQEWSFNEDHHIDHICVSLSVLLKLYQLSIVIIKSMMFLYLWHKFNWLSFYHYLKVKCNARYFTDIKYLFQGLITKILISYFNWLFFLFSK